MDFIKQYHLLISAAIAALVAVNGVVHFVSPDTQAILLALATAAGLYGAHVAVNAPGDPPAAPPPATTPAKPA